jgi:hypothetical protein
VNEDESYFAKMPAHGSCFGMWRIGLNVFCRFL